MMLSTTPTNETTVPSRVGRYLTNVFILSFLSLTVLDAWPAQWIGGEPIEQIQRNTDIITDLTGLWQGPWNLFAPETPEFTMYLSATVWTSNESMNAMEVIYDWRSPRWETKTWFERKLLFRTQEVVDSLQWDYNAPLWEPFSEYLIQLATRHISSTTGEEPDVDLVILYEHWRVIQGPDIPENATEAFDRHWLLGDKVQSTFSEEYQNELYRYRPKLKHAQ